jgi:hypothetical protein
MQDGPDFWLVDCVTIVGKTEDRLPLQQRDDVLTTLQQAYNQKNLELANTVFDTDLVFFFSPADITKGNVPVSQWDRPSELAATANLFGSGAPTGGGRQEGDKHDALSGYR